MVITIDSYVPGIGAVPKTSAHWKADITPSSHILEANYNNALYRVVRDPRDNCLTISSDLGEGRGNCISGSYKPVNTSKFGIVRCPNSAFYDSIMRIVKP